MGVFNFASFGKDYACFFCIEPGGIAVVFFRLAGLPDFHQEGFDDIFLHASGLPEDAFGMNIDVEVAWLDGSDSTRFFFGLAFSSLTMGEARFRGAFGERPLVAPVGVDQKKFDMRIYPPVTDGGYLQGQREAGNSGQTHWQKTTSTSLLQRYFRNVKCSENGAHLWYTRLRC